MSEEKFAAIFDGLTEAYGTYRVEKKQSNGKNTGKAAIVREPRTPKLWQGHLSGKGNSVGIIPINEDNKCKWGCIDVDQYPLDHKLFADDWVEARDMQKALQNISAALGYGDSEIFPKQVKLNLERGDVGNFLNLPYYDAEGGLRYAFLDDGTSADLEEFFELYEAHKQTPEQVIKLQVESTADMADFDKGSTRTATRTCAARWSLVLGLPRLAYRLPTYASTTQRRLSGFWT